jgi:hypothetical protein
MEALVIANVAPVAIDEGFVRQPLKKSNGHCHVLGSLVDLLCRAKMVLQLRWCGVAVEVGLLSVVATHRGPGCHTANTSHASCVGFLCGPLNSRVGSAIENAIEHATVGFANWGAWRRVCNVRRVDSNTQVEPRVTLVALGLDNVGSCGHVEGDSDV